MIIYLAETVGLKCAYDDCYLHARYYFTALFTLLFSMNMLDIIKPKLMYFMRTGTCKLVDDEEEKSIDSIRSNEADFEDLIIFDI